MWRLAPRPRRPGRGRFRRHWAGPGDGKRPQSDAGPGWRRVRLTGYHFETPRRLTPPVSGRFPGAVGGRGRQTDGSGSSESGC